MTGEEFLRQLNDMLADVTEEERREAVRYYEEYLRDAGPEQEQQVLAELGSPARVAAIIRANVPGSRAEPAQSAPAPEPEPPRIRGLAPDTAAYAGTGAAAAAQPAPAGAGRTLLWWLVLLVTSPVWLSVLAVVVSALAGVIGIFLGLAGVLLAVVLAGIICLFVGGVFAVMSLWGLAADLPNTLVGLASCLASMGIGFLLLALGWAVCGRGIPALMRALGRLLRAAGKGIAHTWTSLRRAVKGGD